MAKNIDINKMKMEQFNRMYDVLHTIAHNYYPAMSLRMVAEEKYGLDPDEAIEQAYENMRSDARKAIQGVKKWNNHER